MKSLGVYYWYVKVPRCRCVEHGFEYITFYVQKHIANLAACSGPLLVCDGLLGASAFVKLTYCSSFYYVKYSISLSNVASHWLPDSQSEAI